MDEQQLRALIDEVKSGKLPRRGFIQQHGGPGPDGADGLDAADACRRGPGADRDARLQADQARRWRHAQAHLLAGRGAPEPALRRRHQGPGREPRLLRAAGQLGHRRQPGAGAGRRDPHARQRRPVRRRHERHLEAQARREVARRQGLHRRRRGLHRPVRRRPGRGDDHHEHLQGHQGHEARLAHRARRLPQARTLLGRAAGRQRRR